MILIVLLGILAFVALIIFVASRIDQAERSTSDATHRKAAPLCGILSIAGALFGLFGVAVGVDLDNGTGVALALAALFFGPLISILFGLAGFMTRERPVSPSVFGLFGGVLFALVFLLR